MQQRNNSAFFVVIGRSVAVAVLCCCLSTTAYCQRPPTFPRFNEKTIKALIRGIDKPRNATSLKIGYFALRDESAFPLRKGWELLRVACTREKVASKRWFILQNVKAFAAFRLKFTNKKDGFVAYAQIFEHAQEAEPAHASYYLRQAINEYVNSIPVSFDQFDANKDENSISGLSEAWVAYVISERQPSPSRYLLPDWPSAFDSAGCPVGLSAIAEKQLANKQNRLTFGVLSSAGEIFSFDKPDRAIQVLLSAKELKPASENQQTDIGLKDHVYSQLVSLLDRKNRSSEAMNLRKERIRKLNTGRADLIRSLESHDDVAITKIVDELRPASSSEDEVFSVNEELTNTGYDGATNTVWNPGYLHLAISLFESYLSPARKKSLKSEVVARLRLSALYQIMNSDAEAIFILNVHFPPTKDKELVRLQSVVEARRALLKKLTPLTKAR